MIRLVVATAFVALVPGLTPAVAADSSPEAKCSAAKTLHLPGFDMKVASADHIKDKGPAHCLVSGSFEHRTGADGKPYAIGFSIALPDSWTARFLVQGGGGLNGVVRPALGDVAAGAQNGLSRGFAVISHDSGHKGEAWDASFRADQIATLNFAGWSVEKVTAVGKALVASYYGRPANRSYFAGCSTARSAGRAPFRIFAA